MNYGNGNGYKSFTRTDRFGNPQSVVRLYSTGRDGYRGVVTIGNKRYQLFITRATTPKKENHTHWCAVTEDRRAHGGGGRGL